tara:strand:+ start:488 stop:634 length:147 start_codon:yes stop_codon:yes gene_type:complete
LKYGQFKLLSVDTVVLLAPLVAASVLTIGLFATQTAFKQAKDYLCSKK